MTTNFSCEEKQCAFIRGDADNNGHVDQNDATAILNALNLGIPLPCDDAGDADDDGALTLADATMILNSITGGPPLPAPGPHLCGLDPTVDNLTCNDYVCRTPNDFRRGDCNVDGLIDISDAIFFLGAIFPPAMNMPTCNDACDANDDGRLDVGDAIYHLCAIFMCGPLFTAPFPDCGYDPTPVEPLGCLDYTQVGCP